MEGEQYEEDQEPSTQLLGSSPGYFESMGISIIRGRDFDESDRPPAPATVVVNESLARRHWPDGDAVGKRIKLEDDEDWATIIGVAADTRHRRLNQAPTTQLYVPGESKNRSDGLFRKDLQIRTAKNAGWLAGRFDFVLG